MSTRKDWLTLAMFTAGRWPYLVIFGIGVIFSLYFSDREYIEKVNNLWTGLQALSRIVLAVTGGFAFLIAGKHLFTMLVWRLSDTRLGYFVSFYALATFCISYLLGLGHGAFIVTIAMLITTLVYGLYIRSKKGDRYGDLYTSPLHMNWIIVLSGVAIMFALPVLIERVGWGGFEISLTGKGLNRWAVFNGLTACGIALFWHNVLEQWREFRSIVSTNEKGVYHLAVAIFVAILIFLLGGAIGVPQPISIGAASLAAGSMIVVSYWETIRGWLD